MARRPSSLIPFLLIGFIVVFGLEQFLSLGFVCAPQHFRLPNKVGVAKAAVGSSANDDHGRVSSSIQERVQHLKEASLTACLEASEDNEAMADECATLSYELATAKQLMQMREDEFAFQMHDSDSY